jgi:hypothetical protein
MSMICMKVRTSAFVSIRGEYLWLTSKSADGRGATKLNSLLMQNKSPAVPATLDNYNGPQAIVFWMKNLASIHR